MNPFFQNKYNASLYMLAWIAVSAIQSSILVVYFKIEAVPAISDSLVFNTIFFFFGFLIWYPVRYMPLSNRNLYSILLNHIALGILVIVAWISLGFLLVKLLFSASGEYIDSLVISVPYRIISGLLMYILILMVYYLIVYSRNLKEKVMNENKLNTLVREAELNMLKSQINPHFLFNSLNSVSSLTINNPEVAREMIIKLSEYLRYSLRHSETEKTTLRDEVDNIRRYLDIEKIRFGSRLNFKIDIDEKAVLWPVPNMILQPLFENSVKHGVYESTEPISIGMKTEVIRDDLYIEIRNDIVKESPVRRGAGIGLKNIKERLKLLYDNEDLLSYYKTESEFVVKLVIPRYEK